MMILFKYVFQAANYIKRFIVYIYVLSNKRKMKMFCFDKVTPYWKNLPAKSKPAMYLVQFVSPNI
jgi:hypothetical protein